MDTVPALVSTTASVVTRDACGHAGVVHTVEAPFAAVTPAARTSSAPLLAVQVHVMFGERLAPAIVTAVPPTAGPEVGEADDAVWHAACRAQSAASSEISAASRMPRALPAT